MHLSGTVDLHAGRYDFDYIPQVLPNPDAVTVDVDITNAHATTVSTGAIVARGARSVTFSRPKSEGRWTLAIGLRR